MEMTLTVTEHKGFILVETLQLGPSQTMLAGEKEVVERESTVKGYLLSLRKGREARDTVSLLGSESGRDKCFYVVNRAASHVKCRTHPRA